MHASSIASDRFESVVLGFFEQGLRGCEPRTGGWSWEELHAYNKALDWTEWEARMLQGP